MKGEPIYETERLFLRPTTVEDAAFILAVMNTEGWLKHIGDRGVKTEEDAVNYINEKMRPQQDRLGYSNNTVIRKSDGKKIGSCGLYDREGLEGVDIGFAFLPAYEKQGYAVESALKVKELALEKFGLSQISAITTQTNYPSQRLIEKIGLTFKKLIKIPNDEEELMLYQLI